MQVFWGLVLLCTLTYFLMCNFIVGWSGKKTLAKNINLETFLGECYFCADILKSTLITTNLKHTSRHRCPKENVLLLLIRLFGLGLLISTDWTNSETNEQTNKKKSELSILRHFRKRKHENVYYTKTMIVKFKKIQLSNKNTNTFI